MLSFKCYVQEVYFWKKTHYGIERDRKMPRNGGLYESETGIHNGFRSWYDIAVYVTEIRDACSTRSESLTHKLNSLGASLVVNWIYSGSYKTMLCTR